MPRLIEQVKTEDPALRRFQDVVVAAVNPALANPLIDGRLTDVVALTTSFQNLNHLLGRAPLGWIVVAPDADARVWQDAAASNPDVTKYLRVKASAAVNVRFWVF